MINRLTNTLSGWNWTCVDNTLWEIPDEGIIDFVRLCEKQNANTVLDIGAGIGRHALLFSQMGFNVDALDISKSAIAKLIENSKSSNFSYNVICLDMHDIRSLKKNYDIIIANNSIYHTNMEGLRSIINGIYLRLNNSGVAYITFLSTEDSSYCGETVSKKMEEDGSIIDHIYLSMQDIVSLLSRFNILSIKRLQYGSKDNNHIHYAVIVQK